MARLACLPLTFFEPNEVTLSRIIADLIDPKGTHGQGPLFLNALLSSLGFNRVTWRDPVRVIREGLTAEGRRIDIVVETPRTLLGVENKQILRTEKQLPPSCLLRPGCMSPSSTQSAPTSSKNFNRVSKI
jgi:hypothetical protein